MDENTPLTYKHGRVNGLPIVMMNPSKYPFVGDERERDWRPASEYEIARATWASDARK